MAGLKTPNSTNIAVLDSRVIGDTCIGKFIVDATPSTFIGSGASNVLGAKVKIVNPYGVTIKAYTSDYDIDAPLTDGFEYDIPTQAGTQQYGTYIISLKVVDADDTEYEITKSINVCSYTSDSNPCDDRLRVIASCKNGTVTVAVAEPPTFKGRYAESRTQEWTIDYPTASGLPQLNTTNGNFSLQLFQGVYKIDGTVCATYHLGDNVYLRLGYAATKYKDVKCLLDYTCIWPRIQLLNEKIASNCSQADKEKYASISLNALLLLKTAELANDSGEDASQYISDLEKLLGCQCTCDCSGSPIVNGSPSTSIAIAGCNFTKTTVGLTDIYTFNGKNYFLTEDDTQDVITVSGVNEYGCVAMQQIFYNAGHAYQAMKPVIADLADYDYWAGVVNNTLANLNATCLGYNSVTWAALTFKQKIQALINAACNGGGCVATISGISTSRVGADVLIEFTQTGGFSADVYVDGIFKGNVLAGVGELLITNVADGATHTYSIIPKCSSGSNGVASNGTFAYIGCAAISPPVVTDSTVNGVDCPYDLTTLIYPEPPIGIEVEWHNANNTHNISLVPDPTSVSSGVYYAFAKDSNDCYSAAVAVTLICDGATSCTAPQGLLVEVAVGGFKVSFQSANFPPPLNSYTVKRKAFADPDVDGSYTTIGTPTFNSSTNRWEIIDTTASDNTLYSYKAISNCESSEPSALYTFANLDCPAVTLTPGATDGDYSFLNVGGQVDKYEVTLYDATGSVAISTQTITPAFSSPITGTFDYLTEGTTYKVGVKVFIGSFSKICGQNAMVTTGGDAVSGFISNSTVASITGATVEGVALDYVSGTNFPIGTAQSGVFETDQVGAAVDVVVSVTGVFTSIYLQDTNGTGYTQLFVGAGNYTFSNVAIAPGGSGWFIQVN